MDRDEAQRRVEQLKREHPERATHTWLARESGGAWEVVKLAIPGGVRIDPVVATTEARPKPPQPDDPRPANFRNVGPFGGAV